MGMDAVVDIWIGIKNNELDLNTDASLPKDLNEEFEDCGEVEIEGLCFQAIFQNEEIVGFGTIVYSMDWDSRAEEFDIEGLFKKVNNLMPKVDLLFKRYKIKGKVNSWIITDYR